MFIEPTPPPRTSPRPARRHVQLRSGAGRTGRIVAVAVAGLVATLPTATVHGADATSGQIAGVGAFNSVNDVTCPPTLEGHEDFDSYDPIALDGSLRGCWYTQVDSSTGPHPTSGVYHEQGREIFVGSLDGGPVGTFTTTYRFEAKFDAAGNELKGRCQHPITGGTGTGGFEGITGRLDFKDITTVSPPTYVYRGHLRLP